MSHNKSNLTREEFMPVFLVWNELRKRTCTRCEDLDLVCNYAKGNSFKCNACLKSKSGRAKCSWVAELIEKVVLLANGEELAPRAPNEWLIWILEALEALGGTNHSTTATDDRPAHESIPSGVSVDRAAHNASLSSQIDDDGRVATELRDDRAHRSRPSTELVDDGGFAEEQGDAHADSNIRHRSAPTPSADNDGVREERERDKAQDGPPSVDLVDNGDIAEEQGYPSTHSPAPSIAMPDREGSPKYFRTPSMELPGDLEYPTHNGSPSFWVSRSPAYLRSESVEAPDYHNHRHIGAHEDDDSMEGLLSNRAQSGRPSVGVLDAGAREERDIERDSEVDFPDAEELDTSHFGSLEEEELKTRALELLGEIQDKTKEYVELSNLAELSSRRLPHLMEEAASPKEVSEAAACAAGHLTAARLAKSAAWLAEWERKDTLTRLEQLKASRKRTAVGYEASRPAKTARMGEVASASSSHAGREKHGWG